jgi:F-type H+-transporting ATPase subunit epsilon
MTIRCEIVSQDRSVYKGDVDIVILPGAAGQMGILPNHSPILTTLQFGIITVRTGGKEEYFTVAGGVAEIQPDQVTVLADAAENVKEIDLERAEQAKHRAEESLKNIAGAVSENYIMMQSALRRSTLRIEAARRFRGGKSYPSTR